MEENPKKSLITEDPDQYRWDVNHDIGLAIAALRQYRGMSLDELAVAADYDLDKLAKMERGRIPHKIHNLASIIEFLHGRLAIVPQETEQDPHCQFIEFED